MSLSPHHSPSLSPPEINIRDYLDVLQRRKMVFINVFITVLLVGILLALPTKPVYQARAKLVVPSSSYRVSVVNSSNPIETMLAAAQPDDMYTQMQVLQSAPFLDDALSKAGIKPRPGVTLPFIKVEAAENANVILITAEGGDPQEVAKLANTVVDLHLQRTDLLETTGLRDTTEFVQTEREKATRDLASAEQRLLRFRQEHRVVQLTAEREAQAKQYVALQTKVRESASNVLSTRAQIAELEKRLAAEPIDVVIDSVQENPRRVKLDERLNELKVQRAELLQDFLPDSQRLQAVDERIAGLAKQVEAEPETLHVRKHTPNAARPALRTRVMELEAALTGYVAENNAASAEWNTQKQLVDNLGPWEIQQTRLNNEREAAQSAYTMLSDRLRDLEIRSKARIRTARALERATIPTSPVRQSRTTHVIFAAALALCLAAGIVFLQETLDDRVNTPDDVERCANVPLLGHVPLMGAEEPRLVAAMPARSHIAEAYRAVRSGIGFAGIDAPLRRLLVTSSSKGEGKSVTSLNLAAAMAVDGKSVLLVDADLRRPSVHRMLNLAGAPGLSDVLAGTQPLDAVIHQTEVPNLRVICAGTIPPNPAELLGVRAFDELLDQLQERADVVIFDSPPCMPVTDPLILAARMDGVVLVVHAGVTRKGAVSKAAEMLGRARARVVGVVLNQVQARSGGYYYYDYYHYGGDHESPPTRRRSNHRRNGHERDKSLRNGHAVAVASSADDEAEEV
jgi:capsular exopolysaccharide synthesis family protein